MDKELGWFLSHLVTAEELQALQAKTTRNAQQFQLSDQEFCSFPEQIKLVEADIQAQQPDDKRSSNTGGPFMACLTHGQLHHQTIENNYDNKS